MTTEAPTAVKIERSINWLEANRATLIRAAVIVAVVALGGSFYLWNQGQKELAASTALSDVTPGPDAAAGYLKIAAEYANTVAAPRAVLLAAGDLFASGKYAEAQAQFTRFEQEYAASPLRIHGLLGIAASLDAQNKFDDAAKRYDELIKRYPEESGVAQAKSALARIYQAQRKPELALALYDDLQRTGANSSYGLDASILRLDLLSRHPELAAKSSTSNPIKK